MTVIIWDRNAQGVLMDSSGKTMRFKNNADADVFLNRPAQLAKANAQPTPPVYDKLSVQ